MADHSQSLPDRAGEVLNLMVQKGFGQRPLIFVGHSLGGLLTKQILRTSKDSTNARAQRVAQSAQAVVFLGTPHSGATLASLADRFRIVFGTTVSIEDLRAHDPHLGSLHNWYRNHAPGLGIRTITYLESQATAGLVTVVDRTSGHPGVGEDPTILDEDHLSLAKPRKPDDAVCQSVRELLQGALQAEAAGENTVVRAPNAPERPYASTQLDDHAPRVLFGREAELAALDEAWEARKLNIYTLVAWGGAGKTSLAFHWVQTRFAAKEPSWPGVERYFDWSFYSQGTGESRQTSADLFIAKALAFFGDPDPTEDGPHERGERLAGLIRQHRTLLILDGIEPLQYPPGDPQAGRLKDSALEALLRELAADNPGLVVITTREHLKNLGKHATIEEQKLDKLPRDAAVALLRHLEIVGTEEELHEAWRDAGGHALTLSLLGRYIADAYEDRDIRHYREVNFEEADRERQGRSAFKVMIAYERWLQSGGPARQRELAVLRLTGLFDRPMAKGCLEALRAEPSIPGLTGALVQLSPQQWNLAVKRLSEVELLSVSPDAIDAHPLIREYFAVQLQQEQPEAFRAAHSRLFDFLSEVTPYRPDSLDGLAPLYEAVTHGCLAGRHQEACYEVYVDRILRGMGSDGNYSTFQLGAIGADLAAVAAFFDRSSSGPWSQVSANLSAANQGWLLNEAAFRLRALGRLTEALQPMRVSGEMDAKAVEWKGAAISYSNLSELELTLGLLPESVTDARQSISYADQSGDAFDRMVNRTTAAEALHQCGQRAEAGTLFAEAEGMQQERQPHFNLLYSLRGFQYCDWLLAPAEQAAWQQVLHQPFSNSKSQISEGLAEVERRGNKMFEWRLPGDSLLDIALDHLTLTRVGLVRAILANPLPQPTLDLPHIADAVHGLRAAGTTHELPRALLTASLYYFVRGEHDLAEKHLAEAQQIAERGPMPLFLADIHLNRARFGLATSDRWGGYDPATELKAARELIEKHGYGRRMEELIDAERSRDAALGNGA